MSDRGERVVVTLRMNARMLPDVQSRNVVAELVGRERPQEVVVIGGHIDSWDVGQGAVDDAGGSVAAWEAVKLLQRLGLRPRRTVRVVLWTNEENGLRGADAYRDAHAAELDRHMLAIESDGGVFAPQGFTVAGTDTTVAAVRAIASLLAPLGATAVRRGGAGADVGPLVARGVPAAGLDVDETRYFWYHHSDGDTIDKLDPRETAQCVAAMAVLAYVVAEMPGQLPRPAPR
jgi:carboxypeptidase Q